MFMYLTRYSTFHQRVVCGIRKCNQACNQDLSMIQDFSQKYRKIVGSFEQTDGNHFFSVQDKNTDKKISLLVSEKGFFSWLLGKISSRATQLVRLHVTDQQNESHTIYVPAESVRTYLEMGPDETQGLGRAIAAMLGHLSDQSIHSIHAKMKPAKTLLDYSPDRFCDFGLQFPKKWENQPITPDNKKEFLKDLAAANRGAAIRHPKNITFEEVEFLKEFRQQKQRMFKAFATQPDYFVKSISACKRSFEQLQTKLNTLPSPPTPLMGKVRYVAHEFSFHMPGIALIAYERAQKKHLSNLYVCEHMQAFSEKMGKIAQEGIDCRYAFILPVADSGWGLGIDYPQHKITVGVEKKEGKLRIMVFDPSPSKDKILNSSLKTSSSDVWEGNGEKDAFNRNELIMRALKGAAAHLPTEVVISKQEREKAGGCAVFALCDAETFLQDPDFFSRISPSEPNTVLATTTPIQYRYLENLPPEYMVGTQSEHLLQEYHTRSGELSQRHFVTKPKKTLQDYSKRRYWHTRIKDGKQKLINNYIMWRFFLYSRSVNKALSELPPEEVQRRINCHLL